jgi:hypothetical protein
MNVRAPMMIQDSDIAALDIGRLVEEWEGIHEDHYLDGPVTPRLAVVDLDPNTEATIKPAEFLPPKGRRKLGAYRVDKNKIDSDAFIQVSVFATVLRTMYMYEEPDTLGRQVAWGFDAPQLLVVPRAGWLENAYYERRSHSLQFFSFMAGEQLIHTCLSRDIVAHETAHALIDGIDRDLYDALDPQALGLHEGIADLTAMLLAFRSGPLRLAVLNHTGGSIEDSSEFSSIGVQFGKAIDPSGRAGYLRNLLNDKALDPNGDPAAEPEEHELSEVITGALYKFVCRLHAFYKRRIAAEKGETEFKASGEALFRSAERFKRTILRGLDYLPSGEISFIDYARAILAADEASHPQDERRSWLREELLARGIGRSQADLHVETNIENAAVAAADLQGLVDSDWAAYTFADKNRTLLSIPDDAQFAVLPRLVVTKDYYLGPQPTPVKELLFKVRWSVTEPNPIDLGGVTTRRIQTGTTLVIDWDRKLIRACMKPFDLEGRRRARDTGLRRMFERGLVNVTTPADPAQLRRTIGSGIEAVVSGEILRVRNTAQLLHLAKGIGDD